MLKSIVNSTVGDILGLQRIFKFNQIEPEVKHDGVYHRMSIEDVLKLFKVPSLDKGLDSKLAQESLALSGPNMLPASKSTLYNSILRSFFNGFGPLVWFACVFSFILYEPLGGTTPVRLTFWCNILKEIVL